MTTAIYAKVPKNAATEKHIAQLKETAERIFPESEQIDVYIDHTIGKNYQPKLMELMQDIEEKIVDSVFVPDYLMLGSSFKTRFFALAAMTIKRTRLYLQKEKIHSDYGEGKMFLQVLKRLIQIDSTLERGAKRTLRLEGKNNLFKRRFRRAMQAYALVHHETHPVSMRVAAAKVKIPLGTLHTYFKRIEGKAPASESMILAAKQYII